MGLDQCLVKISWLTRGGYLCLFWWMELNLVSLEGSAVSSSVFWGIYGFSMTLRCLPVNVQGCAPVL